MAIVTVCDNEDGVAALAATRVAALIGAAIAARDAALVCLTGGAAARRLYETLGDDPGGIDWDHVYLFWGDERHVPPEHADSNFGMAHRALISRLPGPPPPAHRIRGELPDASAAAREYETTLTRAFTAAGRTDLTFDVMLLGLGEDAHIASIFPRSPLLRLNGPRVAAVWAPHLGAWRITLTPHAVLDARAILMIVT